MHPLLDTSALHARVADWTSRVAAGERTAVAVTAAGALAAGLLLWRWASAPGDGIKYMNDDQLAFKDPFTVRVRGDHAHGAPGASVEVQPVRVRDIPSAAATLAAANKDDPVIVACASASMDSSAREASLRWLYRTLLSSTVPSSCGAVCLRTHTSVAVWFPKGADVQPSTLVQNGAWQYLFRFSGWERRGRFPGYSEAIRGRRVRLMSGHEGAYFYLLTAGATGGNADKEVEDKMAVVQPVLERADSLGQPCYVEATSEASRDFFASVGFKQLEEFHLYGFTVYSMKREAVVPRA